MGRIEKLVAVGDAYAADAPAHVATPQLAASLPYWLDRIRNILVVMAAAVLARSYTQHSGSYGRCRTG